MAKGLHLHDTLNGMQNISYLYLYHYAVKFSIMTCQKVLIYYPLEHNVLFIIRCSIAWSAYNSLQSKGRSRAKKCTHLTHHEFWRISQDI